ncbi:MAG: coenzyme F430 synthase [Methanosarcinales archaeon]|nr:coenzyme F430 synthase [Methanosarcinales archaeon]
MLFDDKDVTVLDLTHGGILLAQHIAKYARSVTAVDVYGTVDDNVLVRLERSGINIARKPDNNTEINTKNNTDLIVAPVHIDPAFIPSAGEHTIITHHQAVGELLSGFNTNARIFEITGTSAKTSTATLLADMTSRSMSVVSHTSRGVEHWVKGVPSKLHHGLSITPSSILEALEHSTGIEADLYIFEVSLGGTGMADVGIITSLDNEYTIANGSSTSTAAKLQIVELARPGSTLLVNASAGPLNPPKNVNIITFSDSTNADVYLERSDRNIWTVKFNGSGTVSFTPNAGYDAESYSIAIVCAVAAARILEVDNAKIESALVDFAGVHGRMRVMEWAGRKLVDNSNSGMNIRSVRQALDFSNDLASNHDRKVLILGEEAKQVCEGLDPTDAGTFVDERGDELDNIILVGERMKSIQGENIRTADSLNNAIEVAESLTSEDDIIISCVKCFR